MSERAICINNRECARNGSQVRGLFRCDENPDESLRELRRREKCAECGRRLKPNRRGRPRRHCSAACRQRAFIARKAQALVPIYLVNKDIDDMHSKAGIERAVVDVLRKLGFLPAAPKHPPRLHIVRTGDDGQLPKPPSDLSVETNVNGDGSAA